MVTDPHTDTPRAGLRWPGLIARAAALCLAVWALLTVGLLTAARADAPSALAALPGFAACPLPCWAGVTPGETRFAEAANVMAAHLPDTDMSFHEWAINAAVRAASGDAVVLGSLYESRGLVAGIQLEAHVPLWALVDALGTPRCVVSSTDTSAYTTLLLYWGARDAVQTTGIWLLTPDEWTPTAPTFALRLTDTDIDACGGAGAVHWHGFAPLWFYARR